ncbi:EAL domain-containing protein, partial [Citrobacter freundii]
ASAAGVWAMQGALYPSVTFTEVDTLLLPTLCH